MGATYFRAVRKRYGPQDTADVLEVCGACSRAKAFDAMFVHRPLDVFRAIRPLDNLKKKNANPPVSNLEVEGLSPSASRGQEITLQNIVSRTFCPDSIDTAA